jgi:hypothetical protein
LYCFLGVCQVRKPPRPGIREAEGTLMKNERTVVLSEASLFQTGDSPSPSELAPGKVRENEGIAGNEVGE